MKILKGKLTYIVAGLGFLYGVAALISGVIPQTEAAGIIWASLGLFGIRRAVDGK